MSRRTWRIVGPQSTNIVSDQDKAPSNFDLITERFSEYNVVDGYNQLSPLLAVCFLTLLLTFNTYILHTGFRNVKTTASGL